MPPAFSRVQMVPMQAKLLAELVGLAGAAGIDRQRAALPAGQLWRATTAAAHRQLHLLSVWPLARKQSKHEGGLATDSLSGLHTPPAAAPPRARSRCHPST